MGSPVSIWRVQTYELYDNKPLQKLEIWNKNRNIYRIFYF